MLLFLCKVPEVGLCLQVRESHTTINPIILLAVDIAILHGNSDISTPCALRCMAVKTTQICGSPASSGYSCATSGAGGTAICHYFHLPSAHFGDPSCHQDQRRRPRYTQDCLEQDLSRPVFRSYLALAKQRRLQKKRVTHRWRGFAEAAKIKESAMLSEKT